MKTELSKITKDLEQDIITEQEARNLLLGLLRVSDDIDNEEDCIRAVMRWRHHMRPLKMIVHEKDGILLRYIDVGRMLIMCENNSP